MVQLAHVVLVLALVAGAYFLLVRRNSTDSTPDSSSANGFVNGSGLKGANSGTTAALDTGRDFVAALEQAVSRALFVSSRRRVANLSCFPAIDKAERTRIGI